MKKIINMFLLVFALIISTVPVYASESEEIISNKEMTEETAREIFTHSSFVKKDAQGNFIFESNYNPTKSSKTSSNSSHSKTVFVICPYDQEDAENWERVINANPNARADYNTSGSNWDASRSVKIYMTIYYTINGNQAELDYITGGYSLYDSTVSVTSQSIYYACNQGALGQTDTKNKYSSSSWTIWAPSSWSPIRTDVGTGSIGATLTTTAKRSAGSWQIVLPITALYTGS